MSSPIDIRFFHPRGQGNVRGELDTMLAGATVSLRAAVCFFCGAGFRLLADHRSELNGLDSYFIASVDFPTNLRALEELHWLAPGHVYIHLGGKTPYEKNVGRSLMHSKVFLAEDNDGCSLWVGSHNLTASALEGSNFEAGIQCTAPPLAPVIQDAISHLESCRKTAELFDPNEMQRYREIQDSRRKASEWESERNVLVIHAEASQLPTQLPVIVHVNVVPEYLDRLLRMDRHVRLFLYPPGGLQHGRRVSTTTSTLWIGEITAVVKTEYHPRNHGASGQFASANFFIDIPDPHCIPSLVTARQATLPAITQAVIRIDQQGEPGTEVFSTASSSPFIKEFITEGATELDLVDDDMMEFFTPDSFYGDQLVYTPVIGVQENLVIEGYDEPSRAMLADRPERNRVAGEIHRITYSSSEAEHTLDPFFYVSNYVIRPKRRQ